jgi:HSP20 family protein
MNDAPTTEKSTRTRLLIIVLLCAVILLQLGIFFQHHVQARRTTKPASHTAPHWISTLIPRHRPTPPAVTPETVWDSSSRMNQMHAQINRMFEQAFRDSFRISLAPAVVSPPATSDSSAPLDPFTMMRDIHREIDGMFQEAMHDLPARSRGFDDGWSELALTPGMSVKDTGTAYVITVALPNVDKSDIQLGMNGSILSLAVGHQESRDTHDQNAHSTRLAQRISRFEQRLRLPGADSNPEAIKASFEQGILRIVVPKQTGSTQPPGTIKVH